MQEHLIIEPDMAETEASQMVTYVGVEGGEPDGAAVMAEGQPHRVVEYKIMHTTHDASGHEVITAEVLEPVDEVAAEQEHQDVVQAAVEEEEPKHAQEIAAEAEG